jgi:hypothetical protein
MIVVIGATLVAALALRILQVRRVRYARVNTMLKQYAHLVDNLDKMTYKDAEEILKVSQHYVRRLVREV